MEGQDKLLCAEELANGSMKPGKMRQLQKTKQKDTISESQ